MTHITLHITTLIAALGFGLIGANIYYEAFK